MSIQSLYARKYTHWQVSKTSVLPVEMWAHQSSQTHHPHRHVQLQLVVPFQVDIEPIYTQKQPNQQIQLNNYLCYCLLVKLSLKHQEDAFLECFFLTAYLFRPESRAFQALVSAGSTCHDAPDRAGPATNQRNGGWICLSRSASRSSENIEGTL